MGLTETTLHVGLAALTVSMVLQGCVASRPAELPPDVAMEVAALTETVKRGEVHDAAIKLGEIGLEYPLPKETIAALKEAVHDDGAIFEHSDFIDIGGGEQHLRDGDGARIALWMWELRDMKTDRERMTFLGSTFSDPRNGDAVRAFCVEELIKVESDAVIPYLAAAAAARGHMGDWYVRRHAALRLIDFYPKSREALLSLTRSEDSLVARFAEETLKEGGKPQSVKDIEAAARCLAKETPEEDGGRTSTGGLMIEAILVDFEAAKVMSDPLRYSIEGISVRSTFGLEVTEGTEAPQFGVEVTRTDKETATVRGILREGDITGKAECWDERPLSLRAGQSVVLVYPKDAKPRFAVVVWVYERTWPFVP